DAFYLINVYTPNAGEGLKRLEYRQAWDAAFLKFMKKLEKKKPVVVCGDLNVAHTEIDLKNPKSNANKSAGFTDQEREGMTRLLKAGYIDSFRHFHPDEGGHYSWWSYRANARANNVGWRIDYFCVSQRLQPRLQKAMILKDQSGSDHCPVGIVLKDS
ncbi:MAG: exodeoxyribonuclease III, partial [Leptospirales bacterium]